MTGLPNICGPRTVAEYERQCSYDFIFTPAASTGHDTHPKGEDSGTAPTGAHTSVRPAASSPCAADTRPAPDAPSTARTATTRATTAPRAAHESPPPGCRSPFAAMLAVAAVALIAHYAWLLGETAVT